MSLGALNQTILATALPTVVGDLNGVDRMTWVISSYILASTIMMPIYGKISDLVGRRPMLLIAIAVFLVGAVVCATAGSITWLVVGRAVQGIGGGGLLVLSQAAIADVVPARDRGRYMGAINSVYAVASIAGPLLGGWLTEGPGWRWAFWLSIPLGMVAATACILFLNVPHESVIERPQLDFAGMSLIGAWTTVIVLIGTWGGSTYAWTSVQILGLSIAALILALVVALIELKASEPILPSALFRDRNFNLVTTAGLLIGIVMFGTVGYMPTYLQMGQGISATNAGLLMISMMGGLLTTSVISGQIVARTGRYKIFPVIGTLVMGTGLALISTVTGDLPLAVVCTYLAVFGTGIGMTTQILTLIVQNSFPTRVVGTATAGTNYFRQVGATLGSAVVGSLFAARLTTHIQEDAAEAGGVNSLTPDTVTQLPDELRDNVITSYSNALLPIFLWMVPLVAIAMVLLCFVFEKPLSTGVEDDDLDPDSVASVA